MTFDNLFLLGRPACGKSEMIDFLKNIHDDERASIYHIGKFEEVDDFPWLWQACLDDDEREERGDARIYTEKRPEGFNLLDHTFRFENTHKFNQVINENYLSNPDFYNEGSLLIEFARGKADGFKPSLEKFNPEILKRAAILFINVSFQESYRKNDKRYKEGLEGSSLCHKVPDKDMYEYFIENDWSKITNNKTSGFLNINNIPIPFVTMNNEPELPAGTEIALRYKKALDELNKLYICT